MRADRKDDRVNCESWEAVSKKLFGMQLDFWQRDRRSEAGCLCLKDGDHFLNELVAYDRSFVYIKKLCVENI